MSIFEVATASVRLAAVADDEADALSQAVDADLLRDGDAGNVAEVPEPEGLKEYIPEGPG